MFWDVRIRPRCCNIGLAYRRTDLLAPTVYWPMIESSIGIVGACLPLLRPIFTDTAVKNLWPTLRSMISLSSLRRNKANTPSQDYAKLETGNVPSSQNHSSEGIQMS